MSTEVGIAPESTTATPQSRVASKLEHASELSYHGNTIQAAAELEQALAEARAVPYEIEFQTRIQLAMALADAYNSLGDTSKATDMLREESAFAQKISQIMQATGTPAQKRAAMSGYLQIRDRTTQVGLLGSE